MASQEIPSDIVFEILTRIRSLATLARCTSVCKEWNKMIHDWTFMGTYYRRSENLSGYFIQDVPISITPSSVFVSASMFMSLEHENSERQNSQSNVSMADDVIPPNVRILASSNQGLLCCVKGNGSRYSCRYYVCKPATKQWKPLPNPKLRYRSVSESLIVLSSSPLRYKIVRLSANSWRKSGLVMVNGVWHSYYYCEIFDSEVWKWRNIQPLVMADSILNNSSLVVSRTNSIYWHTNNNVVHFDYVQECFNMIPLPKLLVKDRVYYRHMNLVDYEGSLGLTCMRESCKIELWLIKKAKKGKWRKKTVIDIGNLEELVSFPNKLVGFYNGEVALMKTRDEVVFYRVRDHRLGKVELRNGVSEVRNVFQYRSDFEPVKLKGEVMPSRGRKMECLETLKLWRMKILVLVIVSVLSLFWTPF